MNTADSLAYIAAWTVTGAFFGTCAVIVVRWLFSRTPPTRSRNGRTG